MEIKIEITTKFKKLLNTIQEQQSLENNDNCINYQHVNKDGYGSVQLIKNNVKYHYLAHRVIYQLYYNDNITSNDIICHSCDNPSCINPKHLFKGTHNDNVQDKVSKHRQAKGINNGRYTTGYYSKYNPIEKPKAEFKTLYNRSLSLEEVIELKEIIKNKGNKTLKKLSEELGVKYQTLRDLNCGRIYANI